MDKWTNKKTVQQDLLKKMAQYNDKNSVNWTSLNRVWPPVSGVMNELLQSWLLQNHESYLEFD